MSGRGNRYSAKEIFRIRAERKQEELRIKREQEKASNPKPQTHTDEYLEQRAKQANEELLAILKNDKVS